MANLALPTTPSWTGQSGDILRTATLGEAFASAGLVGKLNSSGQLVKADRDADSGPCYLVLNSGAAGDGAQYVVIGEVGGYASLTPSTTYYLSDTAGYLCPLADVSGTLVPLATVTTASTLFFWGGIVNIGAVTNNAVTIASPSQGDVVYRGASAWAKLAAGTKGQVLQTGGSGANPAWAYPRLTLPSGKLADQGAAATVTVKFSSPPTGYQWVPLRLHVQSGTTADATAQLKFAGTAAMDALALDGDAETSTFTDSSAAAGQAVTVDLVTSAGTGDLDAANVFLTVAEVPV